MENVIVLDKPIGMTPLQVIRLFQKKYPAYTAAKLGYAGRLDPMAEGVLLVLYGEENKRRKTYEALEKIYTFDVLFGVATDTYDQLGFIMNTSAVSLRAINTQLPSIIKQLRNKKEQAYPPYSSRTVQGKPLFWWARQNRLQEIALPTHAITIADLKLLNVTNIDPGQLKQRVITTITRVTGNFRQDTCLTHWESYFLEHNEPLAIATCKITCSSGTYIRSLCHEMGNLLGTGGIALRITREAVGSYTRTDALALFP